MSLIDRLKDNKGHKENRNAHKAIQAINSYQCEIYKKRLNGRKPGVTKKHSKRPKYRYSKH
ncbi:hypothetical protein [Helicobacter bilis]|uniref:hypothetical protein n=1 Tax=Helicobacter bilis TaxID=37372 RepID=UPI00051CEF94|nr:hypothetical protein [Helicobacter bilis]MDD7296054.1 hypothetical protein [Helicobacter bilis]MDY4399420.1 hypothetical protein [Helicobacter bilis]